MEALPDKTDDDHYTIKRLREAISGSEDAKRTRGTPMSYLATTRSAREHGTSIIPSA